MNVSSMNKLTSCLKMRCSCLTALCEWEGNNEGGGQMDSHTGCFTAAPLGAFH